MKNIAWQFLIALAVLGFLCGVWQYNRWKYDECRAIGHGSAYCVWERL